jgi:hypothetical protein
VGCRPDPTRTARQILRAPAGVRGAPRGPGHPEVRPAGHSPRAPDFPRSVVHTAARARDHVSGSGSSRSPPTRERVAVLASRPRPLWAYPETRARTAGARDRHGAGGKSSSSGPSRQSWRAARGGSRDCTVTSPLPPLTSRRAHSPAGVTTMFRLSSRRSSLDPTCLKMRRTCFWSGSFRCSKGLARRDLSLEPRSRGGRQRAGQPLAAGGG